MKQLRIFFLAIACGLVAVPYVNGQRFQAARTTLQELRVYPLPNNNTNVWVAGRVTPGDGFEGVFTWVTGSTTATNLGTVFDSVFNSPTRPPGRWLRQYDGPIMASWFGPPSATVESAYTVNAAIDLANSLGGAEVFVPKAIYKVRGDGTNGIVLKNKVRLTFEPGTDLVMGQPTTNDSVAIFVTTTVGTMDDIEINGPVTITGVTNSAFTQFGVAMNVQNAADVMRNVRIRNVTIRNINTDGVSVGGNPSGYGDALTLQWIDSQYCRRHGGSAVNVRGLLIEDSIWNNNTGTVGLSSGFDAEPNPTLSDYRIVFRRCEFSYNLFRGLIVQRGNGVEQRNTVIDQCEMFGNGDDGIAAIECSRLDITDTHSATNGGFGLNLARVQNSNVKGGHYTDNARSGVQVGQSSGNTLSGIDSSQNQEDGVIFNGGGTSNIVAIANTLTGSVISSNLLRGVQIAGASGNTITANTITANGNKGMWVTQSSSYNLITGNIFHGNSSTADGGDASLQLDSLANWNVVSGNSFKQGTKWYYGNAVAGTATSITFATNASALDDWYVHQTVRILSGTGSGQSAVVIAYNGATREATFTGPFAPVADTNSVVEVTAPNRPSYGWIIGLNCTRNRMLGNDLFRAGLTAEWSDAGTDTVKVLPITEGGTSTNDLDSLPGDVGSAGGNFLLDNNKFVKWLTPGGIYENIIGMQGSNTFLNSGLGGDIKFRPNANDSLSVEVQNGTGYIIYRGVPTDSLMYTTGGNAIREATMGAGASFSNGVLTATGSGGTVTSVAMTAPAAFNVAGSPVTGSGTLALTINGSSTTEFLRRDGSWSTISGAGGTLTNFSVGNMSPLFTVSAPTTFPLLTAVDPGAHRVYGWDDTDNAPVMMTLGSGASYDQPTKTWTFSGGGGAGASNAYSIFMEEGVALPAQTNANFIGASLTAVNNAGANRTDITLSQSPAGSTAVVGTGRLLATTLPLQGGGDLSADRTLTVASSPTNSTVVVGTGRVVGVLAGLTSGGTLAQDLVLGQDIPGLTANSAPNPATDYLMAYITGSGAHRKILIQDIGGGTGFNKSYRTKVLTRDAVTSIFTMTPTGNLAGFGVHVRGSAVAKDASSIRTITFTFSATSQRLDPGGTAGSGVMTMDDQSTGGPFFTIGDNGGTYAGVTGCDVEWDTNVAGWPTATITAYFWVEQHGPGTITFF